LVLCCSGRDRAREGRCRATRRAVGSTEDVVEGLSCERATAGPGGLVGRAAVAGARHCWMGFRVKVGKDGLRSDLDSKVVVDERFLQ